MSVTEQERVGTGAEEPLGPIVRAPSRRRVVARQVGSVAVPVLAFFALLAIWEAVTILAALPDWLVPAPTEVIDALVEAGGLPGHFLATLLETAYGYSLSVAVGIPLAVAIVYSRFLERTIYPILLAMQSVPKVAIAPILVLWMGFGIGPKVVIIFLICIFPIVISTASGLKATPAEFMELIRSLSASQLQTFVKVRFPAALPQIFVGLKVAISLAVIGAVVGEFVGADRGLGYIIIISGTNVNTALAFASMLLMSVMSISLFYALVALERLIVPWARHERE